MPRSYGYNWAEPPGVVTRWPLTPERPIAEDRAVAEDIIHPVDSSIRIRPIHQLQNYYADEVGVIWVKASQDATPGKLPTYIRNGYLCVSAGPLDSKGRRRLHYCHRLVLLAFEGTPPPGRPFALHNDGDKKNNLLTNLRWGNAKENSADMVRHGTVRRGEEHPITRLSGDDVLAIHRKHKARTVSYRELANEYNLGVSTVRRIVNGHTWSHLTHQQPQGRRR
jgi:hypothetical protein